MSTDRRVRLRPKDGARGLYYGSGISGGSSASNFRKGVLDQALGIVPTLPWLADRPLADQSPTTPNFFQPAGGLSGQDMNDAQGIADALNQQTFNPFDLGSSISGALGGIFGSSSKSVGGGPTSPSILEPLALTNGLVFPYTPTVDFSQQVDYSSYDPVHSNQELQSYVRTRAPQINISGKFTAQNQQEASYALAAVHFCRTIAKMAFGQSANDGTPPPVILLSAYGEMVFNDIPSIMTSFSTTYPEDIDYVRVPNTNSWVPTVFNLNISLTVQNTPAKLRSFNLESFRSGQLLKRKGWV